MFEIIKIYLMLPIFEIIKKKVKESIIFLYGHVVILTLFLDVLDVLHLLDI